MKSRVWIFVVLLLGAMAETAGADGLTPHRQSLGTYQVDISQSSVSGLSAGAYMADQFFVAFSHNMVGVGVFAGGPYGCARGNLGTALTACMSVPMLLNDRVMQSLIDNANEQAAAGRIDPLDNLRTRRAYIFSGTSDVTVKQGVTNWVPQWYALAGMPSDHILYKSDSPAGHALPTMDYGNACATPTAPPWMSDCDYDGAGAALKQIYGTLNDPSPVAMGSGELIEFPQNEFFDPPGLNPETLRNRFSFNEFGYAYVPQACAAGEACRAHVVFHGCKQVYDKNPASEDADDSTNPFGLQMVLNAGYNEWANTNHLIILYPQAEKISGINPRGCFDWWGYLSGTQQTYATKAGPQMAAVYAMLQRLAGGGNRPPSADFSQYQRQGANLVVAGTVRDTDDAIAGLEIKFTYPPDQATPQKPVDSFDLQSGAFSHSEAWPQSNTRYTVVLAVQYQDGTQYELRGPEIALNTCTEWTANNYTHLEANRAYRRFEWFWFYYYAVGSDDPLGYFGFSTSTVRQEVADPGVYHKGPCPQ